MSDDWVEVPLGNEKKEEVPPEIEIVEGEEKSEEIAPPQPVEQPSAEKIEEDEEREDESPGEPRKKLTRSQRLKIQRDEYARRLAEKAAEAETLRKQLAEVEKRQTEAAKAGFDFYRESLNTELRALRAEFDKAYQEGDPSKIWEVQEKMAELKARQTALEQARENFQKQAVSGKEQRPPAPQTIAPDGNKPNPLGLRFAEKHKEWFGKDLVMTTAARVIDLDMANSGWDPNDPDYYTELERRVQEAFPHKFQQQPSKKQVTPVIQNRNSDFATSNNKVRVVITPEDRQLANRLGISIEQYAKQKARMLAASGTDNYVEVL